MPRGQTTKGKTTYGQKVQLTGKISFWLVNLVNLNYFYFLAATLGPEIVLT